MMLIKDYYTIEDVVKKDDGTTCFQIHLRPDSAVYEGHWIDNVRSGKGRYKWANGDEYEGEWKNDMCSGKGTARFINQFIQYDGDWKRDLPNGYGVLTEHFAFKTSGQWVNGVLNGKAIISSWPYGEFNGQYEGTRFWRYNT